ncbi:hypothetical protein ACHAXR_006711 [Thalassiosira sp. AJA248-18]
MTTAAAATANTQPSGKPQPSRDHHMISLYYCYPPARISPDQLKPHADFHRETCEHLNLGGRIRVSEEGINGVLSGAEKNLIEYEGRLRKELSRLVSDGDRNLEGHNKNEVPTAEWLDMKYCHLRKDIPIEKQLFDTLSVKITREVVSLIEPLAEKGKKKGRARCRQRRKQRRKEKQQLEKLKEGNTIADGGKESTGGEKGVEQTKIKELCENNDVLTKELEGICLGKGQEGPVACANGTALPIEDWEKRTTAVHLSPQEWNEKLLQLSQEKHDQAANGTNNSFGNATQDHSIGEDAILLDTRNIYETRVGHMAVPNLETFFPNTRKFSSLPNALNTEEAAKALAGKQVFMYCTGGVRCERASSYLRAISESNTGAWRDKERPSGIYQLRGGIQKYLESYGNDQQELANMKEINNKDECSPGKDPVEDNATTSNCEADKPCLYRGKNFVFDPRRTDPVIGNGVIATGNGERVSVVGRCVVCSNSHDDYDNGHAPCEDLSARCCRCRVLVLVCNDCRRRVRCWGEPESGEGNGDDQGDEISKMELFCGHAGRECIDEGNIADKVETARF